MPSNDPKICREIEELLSAYALDALDEGEAALVESHLFAEGGCPRCRRSLAELQRVAALLGESVSQQAPPASLQRRLAAVLGPVQRGATPTDSAASPHRQTRLPQLAFPLAASLVVILLASSLAMVFLMSQRVDRFSQRMNRLEQENSSLISQLVQFVADDAYILDRLHQVRETNYLMAAPGTEAMPLQAVGGAGGPQGVLLVSGDGRRAVLMVAGMDQPPATAVYQVWLVRQGQRINVGQVTVDPSGWGTMILNPPEPVFRFDWVGLTPERPPAGAYSPGDMVLGGRITSLKSIK